MVSYRRLFVVFASLLLPLFVSTGIAMQNKKTEKFSEADAKKSISDLISSPQFLKEEKELREYIIAQNKKEAIEKAKIEKGGDLWVVGEWVFYPTDLTFRFMHVWTKNRS